jgi:hypothetical protein
MVFLYMPTSPDSDSRGLWEVQSIASPRYMDSCPRDGAIIKGVIVRGYRNFFKRACEVKTPWGAPALDKDVVRRMLPDAFGVTRGDSARLRARKKAMEETEVQRVHDRQRWQTLNGDQLAVMTDDPSYRREARKAEEAAWKRGDAELGAPR